jgi:hypothetical protein
MKRKEELAGEFQAAFCAGASPGIGVSDFGKMRKLVNPAPTLLLCKEP